MPNSVYPLFFFYVYQEFWPTLPISMGLRTYIGEIGNSPIPPTLLLFIEVKFYDYGPMI